MPYDMLEKLWERTSNPKVIIENSDWNKEMEALYSLGISMESTLQYLYFEKPDFETFKNWIKQREKENTVSNEVIENVLSEEDLNFWDKNGYVIVRNAVSKEDCLATQQAIWDFLGASANDVSSWYKPHEQQKGLMLNFSDHQTLNKNRQSEKIRKAYEQLYKSDAIYKIIDKVSFNPPETDNYRFMGSKLHWDVSLKTPIPLALQGLLYLTDCGPEDGAFHCVPGFHTTIESWLGEIGSDENPREKALQTLTPIPVIANAGDFIIWDNRLPHCASANYGKLPRMVQYLTYLPNNYREADEWL
ncbi:MAG: phytanoyl-CoA dioxygenase [Flavobacterium psychrophilum]|nr:MAG: phytanoyl-CoA dioxygenase [Flavobacterium psychrophilum]